MSDRPTTPPTGEPRAKPPPNYAARRMLVTTVAITAIVAFAVVGWRAVGGDDGGSDSSSGGDWDEVALVDRSTGAVTTYDGDGDTGDGMVGRGRVSEVHSIGDRLALVGPTQVVIDSPGDSDDDESVTISIQRTDTVTPVRSPGRLHLVIGSQTGGNLLIVDVATGEELDVGSLARAAEPQIFADPRLFAETVRWSGDSTRFAVADASSFQTIVVREGAEDVAFFGAQPVALSNDLIATSQTIGGQTDIEILDDGRDTKAQAPTPIPAGGIMVDDDLLMVAIDGGVHIVESGASEARKIGQVAVPSGATVAEVRPTLDGERLVVSGGVFEAIIDLDGNTVFTTTFTTPVPVATPRPDWTCLAIGGGTTYHSLVALESGDQLADLSGIEVSGASEDGCTVLGTRSGVAEVISADGTVSIGQVRAATLGPDGRTVVRTTTTGVTEVLTIDDDLQLGDPIELTDAPTNVEVAFLD